MFLARWNGTRRRAPGSAGVPLAYRERRRLAHRVRGRPACIQGAQASRSHTGSAGVSRACSAPSRRAASGSVGVLPACSAVTESSEPGRPARVPHTFPARRPWERGRPARVQRCDRVIRARASRPRAAHLPGAPRPWERRRPARMFVCSAHSRRAAPLGARASRSRAAL